MDAMIYGLDAVPTPDPVVLPAEAAWFTQGNGTSIQGTQVPSYWVNKVGGEIRYAITALQAVFGGAGIVMTSRQQLGTLLAQLLTEKANAPPNKAGSGTGVSIGPGYNQSISLNFTPPCNGTVLARAKLNLGNVAPFALTTHFSNTADGSISDGDISALSQEQSMVIPVTGGVEFTMTYNVAAPGGSWSPVTGTFAFDYSFTPGL